MMFAEHVLYAIVFIPIACVVLLNVVFVVSMLYFGIAKKRASMAKSKLKRRHQQMQNRSGMSSNESKKTNDHYATRKPSSSEKEDNNGTNGVVTMMRPPPRRYERYSNDDDDGRSQSPRERGDTTTDLFHRYGLRLPEDMIVHICQYLHPRSVTTLACVNRASRDLVNDSPVSHSLWKSLWFRDYGNVLLDWPVSRQNMYDLSLQQLLRPPTGASVPRVEDLVHVALDRMGAVRDFYFVFQECYVDYVLAGHNTPQSCFLGLHGHLFDFTDFAPYHPGLSDPILVEGGRDVTAFFEDVRHSTGARKIARKLCVVLDRSCLDDEHEHEHDSCGLCLPSYHKSVNTRTWTFEDSNTRPPPHDPHERRSGLDRVLPMKSYSAHRRRPPGLYSIRTKYAAEKNRAETHAAVVTTDHCRPPQHAIPLLCGVPPRVFYDPFQHRWKAWYNSDQDWKPVIYDVVVNTPV